MINETYKMKLNRRQFNVNALAAAAAAGSAHATAHSQSVSAVTIYVGFPAGTTPDILARKVGERLTAIGYCKSAVVENRLGAGGQLAVVATKSAQHSGASILLTPMSVLGLYPYTYRKLPYDPISDLIPVSKGTTFDYGLAVGPAIPESVKSIPELMAWYKANPGKANMASTATGSTLHFTVIMLGRAAGVELTHVGYKGSSPAIADMLGGNIGALVAPLGAFLNQPSLRVLGTSGARRSRFTPSVATFSEQGFSEMVSEEWYGFYLPSKVKAEAVSGLNAALKQALSSPDLEKTMAMAGMEVTPSSPEELASALQADMKRWGPIVRSTGFTADN